MSTWPAHLQVPKKTCPTKWALLKFAFLHCPVVHRAMAGVAPLARASIAGVKQYFSLEAYVAFERHCAVLYVRQ